MQINWFTVIAQVVNFLILVWLLKKFLYKPILDAIDEREKKIVAQIADAEAKKTEAGIEQAEFRQKNETFEQEKKGMMDKALADTNAAKQKLLNEARNEAEALRAKQEKALQDMQKKQENAMAREVQTSVFSIARKTLADLASVGLEEQATNMFIKRLNELKEDEKKQFAEAFKSSSNPVIVRSAFDLPPQQQTAIKDAINNILGSATLFQFQAVPELVSGIELIINGYKLSWSVSAYLSSLEENIAETMKK